MLWTHKNISARIWPHDHCPPHVTFVCRADNWTARFRFSMVSPGVTLWDVKPLVQAPALKLLNELADQVDARIDLCRAHWWQSQKTVCLDHQPVFRAADGLVYLGRGHGAAQGVISAASGQYGNGMVKARITWNDDSFTDEEICS
jgi:hypothetical protein